MPPGSPGRYLTARLDGNDVAGTRSPAAPLPPPPGARRWAGVRVSASAWGARRSGGVLVWDDIRVGWRLRWGGGGPSLGRSRDVRGTCAAAGRQAGCNCAESDDLGVSGPRDTPDCRQWGYRLRKWSASGPGVPSFTPAPPATPAQRHPHPAVVALPNVAPLQRQAADEARSTGAKGRPAPAAGVQRSPPGCPSTPERRAEELGGIVVQGPFSSGVTRIAVLRDPQGAVLTVSRYQPG
jgi:hypothetical protein